MWLRPWHVIGCVITLSAILIGCAYIADDRAKDILLGLGVNLLSSVVFFVLLETYWQRMKRANGKEVDGFDYLKFARNVGKSRQVRFWAPSFIPSRTMRLMPTSGRRWCKPFGTLFAGRRSSGFDCFSSVP